MHFNFYEGGGMITMPPPIYTNLTPNFCLFWVGFIKCNFLSNLQEWQYTIDQDVINLTWNFFSFLKRSCFFSFSFPWTFYISSPTCHLCKSFSAQTIGLPHYVMCPLFTFKPSPSPMPS